MKDDRLSGKQWFLARGKGQVVGEDDELDFGDLADYEGLVMEDDDENDEDYDPSDQEDDDEDDDDDYDSESEDCS